VRKIVEKEKIINSSLFSALLERINRGARKLKISSLHGSEKAFLISLISQRLQRT
jgi:hypothetical protein